MKIMQSTVYYAVLTGITIIVLILITADLRDVAAFTAQDIVGYFYSVRRALGLAPDKPTILGAPTGPLSKTNISVGALRPGDCVDLAELTGIERFRLPQFAEGTFYDQPYCVDVDGDGQTEDCFVGRFKYTRGKNCWIFQGNLRDLRGADVDPNVKWQLRTDVTGGLNYKAPIETCPFPKEDCGILYNAFNGADSGYKTLPNGNKYYYDGKYVSRVM